MSQLERFATSVAKSAGVVPHSFDATSAQPAVVGAIDIAGLIALIEAIGAIVEKLIANCPNKPALPQAAANPTWAQRVRLRRMVADECECCGVPALRRERGRVADSILSVAAATPAAELEAMVSEAVDYEVL